MYIEGSDLKQMGETITNNPYVVLDGQSVKDMVSVTSLDLDEIDLFFKRMKLNKPSDVMDMKYYNRTITSHHINAYKLIQTIMKRIYATPSNLTNSKFSPSPMLIEICQRESLDIDKVFGWVLIHNNLPTLEEGYLKPPYMNNLNYYEGVGERINYPSRKIFGAWKSIKRQIGLNNFRQIIQFLYVNQHITESEMVNTINQMTDVVHRHEQQFLKIAYTRILTDLFKQFNSDDKIILINLLNETKAPELEGVPIYLYRG